MVGKFVEFYGSGLSAMSVPDRATISNMAPEYGATVGYFPVDARTLEYMYDTGRPEERIALVEAYCKAQGVFRDDHSPNPQFEATLELDLGSVRPAMAGPKRPQDRIALGDMKKQWGAILRAPIAERGYNLERRGGDKAGGVDVSQWNAGGVDPRRCGDRRHYQLHQHQQSVGIGRRRACGKARRRVRTNTQAVGQDQFCAGFGGGHRISLKRTGLMTYLEQVGFYLVGYGCTTCIGNSGPLPEEIASAVIDNDLVVAGVLSGNRNFEGRVNPLTKANFLASPPLVVAYALAGTVKCRH